MISKFIVVYQSSDKYNYKETRMHTTNSQSDAISAICNIGSEETVDRVFEVDEYGNVTHYNVEFKGRLQLVVVPKQMPPTGTWLSEQRP